MNEPTPLDAQARWDFILLALNNNGFMCNREPGLVEAYCLAFGFPYTKPWGNNWPNNHQLNTDLAEMEKRKLIESKVIDVPKYRRTEHRLTKTATTYKVVSRGYIRLNEIALGSNVHVPKPMKRGMLFPY